MFCKTSPYLILFNLVYAGIKISDTKKSKLNQDQISFLCNQSTLKQWAGKSLQERCKLFHRQFPNVKISATTLSKIYRYNAIKKKSIQYTKSSFIKCQEKQEENLIRLKQEFQKHIDGGYEIVFLDETMFIYNTLYTRDYSNKGLNLILQEKALIGQTLAVVAGVSLQNGLEHYEIFENSVNKDKFLHFLRMLQIQTKQRKIALFLDNLRVHHNKDIKRFCQEQQIPLIFNIPYSPQYNPIEEVFSIIKNQYKRLKLNQVLNEEKYNSKSLVKESFLMVTQKAIQGICKSGHKKLLIKEQTTILKNYQEPNQQRYEIDDYYQRNFNNKETFLLTRDNEI